MMEIKYHDHYTWVTDDDILHRAYLTRKVWQWLNGNKIQYELETMWDSNKKEHLAFITFTNNADAVLFKLRWL